MGHRAVFLDRDGVINVRLPGGEYVTRWEEFAFCEGVPEALRKSIRAGLIHERLPCQAAWEIAPMYFCHVLSVKGRHSCKKTSAIFESSWWYSSCS